MAASLRRRSLLTAGLLAALTACGGGASSSVRAGHASPRPSATPLDPDTAARRRIGAAMTTLLAGYDNASAHAELRRGLAAQAAALGAAAHPTASASPSSAATAAGSPATSSAAPAASTSAAGAPATRVRTTDAELVAGESGLLSLCATELDGVSPALARLLASIGAGAAQRAAQLGGRPAIAPAPKLDGLRPGPAELDAWQAALGAEQASVFGYGVLGALLSGGRRAQATADYQVHRARRDTLEALVAASGATPHPAAAAYDLPFQVTDSASARRLAALLETRLAAVYANAVQAGAGTFRDEAAVQLRLAALRTLTWGAAPTPFPGLPER